MRIEKFTIINASGCQICIMRSRSFIWDLLKSKFNCITKFFFPILVIFGDFGSKSRENIDFLPIYKKSFGAKFYYLKYFEYFLSKKFLSSLEFSNYNTCTSSQAHGVRVPFWHPPFKKISNKVDFSLWDQNHENHT